MVFNGERILERAKSRPLSIEDFKRSFEKTDNFPYLPEICVETDGVFIPISELNSLRRKVYSEYFSEMSKNTNVQYDCKIDIPINQTQKNDAVAVIATDLNGAKAQFGILKPHDYSVDCKQFITDFNGEKYLYLPPYLSGEDIEKLSKTVQNFDGIYCDNYCGLELAEEWHKKLFAGTGFNITNRLSLSLCEAKNICLSKELTLCEADALADKSVFYLAEGGIKVMDLIYCPFEKKCSSCDKCQLYTLTDENGRKFPLRRYKMTNCAFELYNCAKLSACNALAGKLIDNTIEGFAENFTRGHTINGIY